jgi:hypothetical protein
MIPYNASGNRFYYFKIPPVKDSLQNTYQKDYHLKILYKASTSQLDSDRDVILVLSWNAARMVIYYLVHPYGVP